jgi:hypothetical protein
MQAQREKTASYQSTQREKLSAQRADQQAAKEREQLKKEIKRELQSGN